MELPNLFDHFYKVTLHIYILLLDRREITMQTQVVHQMKISKAKTSEKTHPQ